MLSPGSWDIGEWSECSKTCGLGMQHRQVLCRQVYANRTLNVHTSHCRHLEKPETASTCQLKICSEWQIRTDWSAVSISSKFSSMMEICTPSALKVFFPDLLQHNSHHLTCVSLVLCAMWARSEVKRGTLCQQRGWLCPRWGVQHESAAHGCGELWHGGMCQELVLHWVGQQGKCWTQ